MRLTVPMNYYDWDKGKLFLKNRFTLTPNAVTYLIGPNGAGKSTLLFHLNDKLRKSKVLCINIKDMDLNMFAAMGGDMINQFVSSEGRARQARVLSQFGDAVRKVKEKIDQYDSIMFLLDSIDSGMSLDVCDEFNDLLNKVIIPDIMKLGKPWYLVIAVNQYELVKDAKHCLAIPTLEYVTFETYQQYKDLIIQLKLQFQ